MPRKAPPKGQRPPSNRQTLLTDEVQESVLGYIRAGNLVETAAAANGISGPTLRDWLRIGAKARRITGRLTAQQSRCLAFLTETERARAQATAADITLIANAGRQYQLRTTTSKDGGTDADGQQLLETTVRDEQKAGDWRARAWLVERRESRWNVRVQAEAAGQPSAPGDDVDAPDPDPAADIIVRIQGMRGRMATPTDQEDDGGA